MSELAQALKTLRGEVSQQDMAKAAGTCLRTLQRAELGYPISLTTLRLMANRFQLNRSAYAWLLLLWVRDTLGPDCDLLRIKLAGGKEKRGAVDEFTNRFRALPAPFQRELMRASLSEPVLRALSALNDAFAKLESGPRKNLAD